MQSVADEISLWFPPHPASLLVALALYTIFGSLASPYTNLHIQTDRQSQWWFSLWVSVQQGSVWGREVDDVILP